MKAILGSLVLLIGLTANAGLLTLSGGSAKLEGVTLNQTAKAADSAMSLVGAGIRTKKVVLVNVKVYVTELFTTDATKYSRDNNALRSLEGATATALRLTFLRGVSASDVAKSYRDALAANSVNLNDPAIVQFLNVVAQGGDAAEGKSFVILLIQSNSGTKLHYEDTNGKMSVVEGPRALQQQILSIWLGNSADSGLETLKKSLLKPVY